MLRKVVVSNYNVNTGIRLWQRKLNKEKEGEREKRNQSHFRRTGWFSPALVSLRQPSNQVKISDGVLTKVINGREVERRSDVKH